MAFSHVPVALKMILQSGSIGKAAPSYGELCRFESGLCNRAPYTNTVRWPGFQPGDTGSSPVGVIYMDSWPTGRGSRLKPGKGSFDSNTVHLRAYGLGPVWTANPYVDGSNPSVHFMSHSFNRRGQRTSNPPIRVRILYETSGYVAKRLCSGLLTRQTQVRVLSCPLLLINALVMQRQHTGLPNLVCGFDSRSGLSLGRIAEFVWFLHSR